MTSSSNLTFEQYMRRPVYVAQVKTATLAGELGIMTYKLRLLPAYRDHATLAVRKALAEKARELRNSRQPFPWPADDRNKVNGTRDAVKSWPNAIRF